MKILMRLYPGQMNNAVLEDVFFGTGFVKYAPAFWREIYDNQ
jgi:hypothetical protein